MTRWLPRRRRTRVALGIVLALLVTWLIGCYLVIVDPSVDRPAKADAIVVLGSPTAEDRLGAAIRLVDADVSTNLVISLFPEDQPLTRQRYCETARAGLTVTCFRPDPATTRGEAQHVRALAADHGWTSIVVVTSTYHVSRARMLFQRCFAGRLLMVGTSHGMSVGKWAYEYFYQTGAYVKAAIESGC